MTEQQFIRDVLANSHNRAIMSAWNRLGIEDGWLVAGCLFQTVWNVLGGREPEADIKDYDVFYFDASDLSEAAERQVQRRVERELPGIAVEVKNQARVHLWYESHFGFPYRELANSREGIDRFLIPATCVGIRPGGEGYEVYAPNGLDALYTGSLAPNPLTDHRDLFSAKAASYRERWPWLQVHG